MAAEDLNLWLSRVRVAPSRKQIFNILDEFRKLEWTDEQRSMMAKLYIRVLEQVADDGADSSVETTPAAVAAQDNGPVWYEKM